MNKSLMAVLTAGALATGMTANAQLPQLFASSSNRGGDSTAYYRFDNSGSEFFTTINGVTKGRTPILFTVNIGSTLSPNPVNALVEFNLTTAGACTTTVGGDVEQPLSGGTLRIFRDAPGNELLLTATFSSSTLSQTNGVTNFGASDVYTNGGVVTNPNVVAFTSPYVTTQNPEAFTFSFSGGATLACNANGRANSGSFAGNGNYSAGPNTTGVPEPGAIGMLVGTGVTGTLFMLRRRRK
jgi:hypothetical protein